MNNAIRTAVAAATAAAVSTAIVSAAALWGSSTAPASRWVTTTSTELDAARRGARQRHAMHHRRMHRTMTAALFRLHMDVGPIVTLAIGFAAGRLTRKKRA